MGWMLFASWKGFKSIEIRGGSLWQKKCYIWEQVRLFYRYRHFATETWWPELESRIPKEKKKTDSQKSSDLPVCHTHHTYTHSKRGWRDVSVVRSTVCLAEDLDAHGGSQPSVPPVLGNSMPSDLLRHRVHIHKGRTVIHIKEVNLKL